MCLILFAYQAHPEYPLILLANRDEFFNRPALPAHFWEEEPSLLAGKDLSAGGSWLGITRTGRLSAITNFRAPTESDGAAASRGDLVKDFLIGNQPTTDYLESIQSNNLHYNGFNLLAGDRDSLWYQFHPEGGYEQVPRGFHGLSNARLNSPWPKVRTGIAALKQAIKHPTLNTSLGTLDEAKLLDILTDQTPAADADLPDTGVGIEMERVLSSRFIHLPQGSYGTRASTLLSIHKLGKVRFIERTWGPDATLINTSEFEFELNDGC